MPKPVYLLTMQETQKEYNSLTDQIWAKYEQLDSSKYRAIPWSLWIGKSTCSCEPTLPETEPPESKGIIQAHIPQALRTLFWIKITIGRQFV